MAKQVRHSGIEAVLQSSTPRAHNGAFVLRLWTTARCKMASIGTLICPVYEVSGVYASRILRHHSVRDWALFRLLSIGVVHAGTFFRKNSTEVVLVQERVWLLLGNIAALLECKHLANSGGSTFQMAVKAICVYN